MKRTGTNFMPQQTFVESLSNVALIVFFRRPGTIIADGRTDRQTGFFTFFGGDLNSMSRSASQLVGNNVRTA